MSQISRRAALRLFSGASSAALLASLRPVDASTTNLQDITGGSLPLPQITVYMSRDIITMDPDTPRAEAVAVAGNRIAAVGSRDDIADFVGEHPFGVE